MGQTRGERVHELLKSLDLTLEKFGERLGVQKSAMSRIERGVSSLTDQMAKLICQTFHVNEAWLLDGVGEMFADVPDALLGELYRRYDCSETSQWIIEEFLKLGPDDQDVIYKFICNVYQRGAAQATAPDGDAAAASRQEAIDRKVADYRERLEIEARQEDSYDASSQGSATA